MRKVLIPVLIILSFGFLSVFASPVYAACTDKGCTGCTDAKLDLACQRARLFSPDSATAKSCTLYYCSDNGGKPSTGSANEISLNLFGVTIRINTDSGINSLLFLGFNMFLGVVAIALVVIGIRAAIRRARAESDDEVAAASKTIQNSAIGFAIIILSLLIVQLVASAVGVGSVAQLVNFSVLGN